MVFVCGGRAEQGEDAVAGGLHDIATITVDRLDHQLERRIDNRTGLFRVEFLHQFGGALEIGEECRDSLALALDSFRVRGNGAKANVGYLWRGQGRGLRELGPALAAEAG